MKQFSKIEQEIEYLTTHPEVISNPDSKLLALGENILELWLSARGVEPTHSKHEGFRLLALHRQGSIEDSTFLACRETCRELIYLINLYRLQKNDDQITLSAMVAMHLLLFVRGKMENESLGEFCCSSKAMRSNDRNT